MVLNLEIALNGLRALNVLSTRKNPILVELFDAVNDELITDTCLKHAKNKAFTKTNKILFKSYNDYNKIEQRPSISEVLFESISKPFQYHFKHEYRRENVVEYVQYVLFVAARF